MSSKSDTSSLRHLETSAAAATSSSLDFEAPAPSSDAPLLPDALDAAEPPQVPASATLLRPVVRPPKLPATLDVANLAASAGAAIEAGVKSAVRTNANEGAGRNEASPCEPGAAPHPDSSGARSAGGARSTGGASSDDGPFDLTALPRLTDIAGLSISDLGLPPVVVPVDDPDAPALPLSDAEPPPVSSIDPALLRPDLNALAGLQRLAGPAADPERSRNALVAALGGQPYNPRDLPEVRSMVLGIARVLVQAGVPADALIQSIVDAMLE